MKHFFTIVLAAASVCAAAQDNPCPNPEIYGTTYDVIYFPEIGDDGMCFIPTPIIKDGCIANWGDMITPELIQTGYRVPENSDLNELFTAYELEDFLPLNVHSWWTGLTSYSYGTGATGVNLNPYAFAGGGSEPDCDDVTGQFYSDLNGGQTSWTYVIPTLSQYNTTDLLMGVRYFNVTINGTSGFISRYERLNSHIGTSGNFSDRFISYGQFAEEDMAYQKRDFYLVHMVGEEAGDVAPDDVTYYEVNCDGTVVTPDTVVVTETVEVPVYITDTVTVTETVIQNVIQTVYDCQDTLVVTETEYVEVFITDTVTVTETEIEYVNVFITDTLTVTEIEYVNVEIPDPSAFADGFDSGIQTGYNDGYAAGLEDCDNTTGIMESDGSIINVVGYYDTIGRQVTQNTPGIIIRKHSDGTFSKFTNH